jgi:hypothetical protein
VARANPRFSEGIEPGAKSKEFDNSKPGLKMPNLAPIGKALGGAAAAVGKVFTGGYVKPESDLDVRVRGKQAYDRGVKERARAALNSSGSSKSPTTHKDS